MASPQPSTVLKPAILQNWPGDRHIRVSPHATERLIGFEFELIPGALQRVLPQFNTGHPQFELAFEKLKKTPGALPEWVTRDYLKNSNALASLPPELQKKLTEGMDLSPVEIQTQKVKLLGPDGKEITSASSTLLDAQGKPLSAQTTSLYTPPQTLGASKDQPLIQRLPEKPKAELATGGMVERQSGLMIDRSAQYDLLQKRWNDLPEATRLKYAKFQYLNPYLQSELIIRHEIKFDHDALKATAPEVFQHLTWHKDLKSIEFKLIEPTGDRKQAEQWIREFSRTAAIDYELENPFRAVKNDFFSFHLHYSHANVNPELLEKLNLAKALRIYHQGPHRVTVLEEMGRANTYGLIQEHRGVMSTGFGPNHGELREHEKSPYAELDEMDDLFLHPKPETLANLNHDIDRLLTQDAFDHISKHYLEGLKFGKFEEVMKASGLPSERFVAMAKNHPDFMTRFFTLKSVTDGYHNRIYSKALTDELIGSYLKNPATMTADEVKLISQYAYAQSLSGNLSLLQQMAEHPKMLNHPGFKLNYEQHSEHLYRNAGEYLRPLYEGHPPAAGDCLRSVLNQIH